MDKPYPVLSFLAGAFYVLAAFTVLGGMVFLPNTLRLPSGELAAAAFCGIALAVASLVAIGQLIEVALDMLETAKQIESNSRELNQALKSSPPAKTRQARNPGI